MIGLGHQLNKKEFYMLRIADGIKAYPIKILDTIFYVRSMSVLERKIMLTDMIKLDGSVESFKSLLDMLSSVIIKIDGYENVSATLLKMEFMADITTIVKAVVDYSTLSEDDAKNFVSSPERPITDSVRDAETNASQN